MIPRLTSDRNLEMPAFGFLERLIELGFRGDIETGHDSAVVSSTDNSIYEILPAGVLLPRDSDDLVLVGKTLAEPEYKDVIVSLRGGGTGTNGQSLSRGYVIDLSRHMNRILSIDPIKRTARVEPGVVKDQLNLALKPHGLFFAPELSTSNRATIGGMISTDACGQGSCIYGKTSNHVLGMRVILSDGTDFWSCPVDAQTLESLIAKPDRVGDAYRIAARVHAENRERIDATFPKLNRFMTGYDLAHLRDSEGRFNLNSILCGSEGTLAFIAEAELNLLPLPAETALVNVLYDDFNAALEDARTLTSMCVASVETIDQKVLNLAKGDIVWPSISRFFPDAASAQTNGINIVEVLADTREELAARVAAVTDALMAFPAPGRRGHTIADRSEGVQAIWTMRKRAVGLLGNVEGPVRPVAFVEDTAVPPENLAGYIREFRALLDAEGLDYGMFGHVDAGVLHVRPALDLTRPEHAAMVRRISDAVVALTRKHGGVLWGEHGKGVRSEYVPDYFGELYPSLQAIKNAFDPRNQLNPGKIASPSSASLMRIDEVPLRGQLDRKLKPDVRSSFGNASYCNGNGACFDFDSDSAMCPSFKGTRDRRYSPKGRAMLFKEWLRLLADAGVNPLQVASKSSSGYRPIAWALRTWNSLSPSNRADFSHEVRKAMDTCLACKACAGSCPVKVNVPDFRAKFLELYHTRYVRPLKDPIVAMIERSLPWLARVRLLYNGIVGSKFGGALMELAGLTALPEMPSTRLWSALKHRGIKPATVEGILMLSESDRARTVVFVIDAFTAYFDPQPVLDAVALARKLGFIPFVRQSISNGKALHVHGYLRAFRRVAGRNADELARLASTGAVLVGLDPSMTLIFRSEYKDALGSIVPVLLPQEWLARNVETLVNARAGTTIPPLRLLLHCTERTNLASAPDEWKAVFDAVGASVLIPALGCCGMAGTFGHEKRNRQLSNSIYAMSWEVEMSRGGNSDPIATGFSCRCQVKKVGGRQIRHPIEVLNMLVLDFHSAAGDTDS